MLSLRALFHKNAVEKGPSKFKQLLNRIFFEV